jgi:hypothetical protein
MFSHQYKSHRGVKKSEGNSNKYKRFGYKVNIRTNNKLNVKRSKKREKWQGSGDACTSFCESSKLSHIVNEQMMSDVDVKKRKTCEGRKLKTSQMF